MITKVCNKCGEELPLSTEYFRENKKGSGKFRNQCKKCESKQSMENYNRNREERILKHKEWRENNSEHVKEYRKKYNLEHIEERKEYSQSWRQNNNENIKDYNKKYRETNKEEIQQYRKNYRIKNLDYLLNIGKIYRKENREKLRNDSRKYYAEHKEQYKKYHKDNAEHYLQLSKNWKIKNPEKVKKSTQNYYIKNKDLCIMRSSKYRKEHPDYARFHDRKKRHKRRSIQNNLLYDFTNEQWDECKIYFKHCCAYCGEKNLLLEQDHFIPLSNGGGYTKNNILPSCKSCNSSKNNRNFFIWYPKQDFYSKEREIIIIKYLNYDEDC